MERILPKIKGRGSAENPANRFEKIEYIQADVGNNEANDAPKTVFYKDHSGTIISYNKLMVFNIMVWQLCVMRYRVMSF